MTVSPPSPDQSPFQTTNHDYTINISPYVFLFMWAVRNIREDKQLMEAKKHPKSEWRQFTQEEKDELDDFLTPYRFPEAIKLDEHEKALA